MFSASSLFAVDFVRIIHNTFQCEARLIISDPQLREVAEVKISNMKTWFDTKLEEAKLAAAQQEKESANNDSKFFENNENGQ